MVKLGQALWGADINPASAMVFSGYDSTRDGGVEQRAHFHYGAAWYGSEEIR